MKCCWLLGTGCWLAMGYYKGSFREKYPNETGKLREGETATGRWIIDFDNG